MSTELRFVLVKGATKLQKTIFMSPAKIGENNCCFSQQLFTFCDIKQKTYI